MRWTLPLIILLAAIIPGHSQRLSRLPEYLPDESPNKYHEFTFARMQYSGGFYGRRGRGGGGGGGSWATDYPKGDYQFIAGLRGWAKSLLALNNEPIALSLHDPNIYNHPFIYCVEPGQMELSDEDANALREYLLRGGFLIMDDFWGEYEWQTVQDQLRKVFPDIPIKELSLDHSVFHCYYDINEVVQVPQSNNWIYSHQTSEKGGVVPHYDGISDKDGRLMVFIARNTDNGDAWEWIDDPRYSLKYGLAAYRLGMNVIVYSMTH